MRQLRCTATYSRCPKKIRHPKSQCALRSNTTRLIHDNRSYWLNSCQQASTTFDQAMHQIVAKAKKIRGGIHPKHSSCGASHCVVRIMSWYREPFRCGTVVWRTDRRTDRIAITIAAPITLNAHRKSKLNVQWTRETSTKKVTATSNNIHGQIVCHMSAKHL